MKTRLLPIIIVAFVGLSLLTGCSAIGYAIGRGIDPEDTTFSIRFSPALQDYVGKKITVVDNNRQAHNAKLDSLVLKSDSVRKRLFLTEAFFRSGEKHLRSLEYEEDKVIEIMTTQSRGSARYVLGGIGLAIDVAAIAFAIAFGNTWSNWGGHNWGR